MRDISTWWVTSWAGACLGSFFLSCWRGWPIGSAGRSQLVATLIFSLALGLVGCSTLFANSKRGCAQAQVGDPFVATKVGPYVERRERALLRDTSRSYAAKARPRPSISSIVDPPFNSGQNYHLLFKTRNGTRSAEPIPAFEDTWGWDAIAAAAFQETVEAGGRVRDVLIAFRQFLGDSDLLAYLSMMAPRLVELRRVLKTTGSLYLHCDPTASHYLKMLMDAVFGPENFRNEIVWRRHQVAHGPRRSFGPIQDTLLLFRRRPQYFFQVVKRPYMKGHVDSR